MSVSRMLPRAVARKVAMFRRMPEVYEANYALLLRVVAGLEDMETDVACHLRGHPSVQIKLTRVGPHTSIMMLSHGLAAGGRLIPNIRLEIRIYHDARMAEVIAYQGKGRFRPYYSVPNRHMYQPHEKQLVNFFFHEWLEHCRRQSVVFELDT